MVEVCCCWVAPPPALSWSIEEKVGLKVVPDAAPVPGPPVGGFVSLAPKELEAVVDMRGPVPPSEAAVAPPGFSFNCLLR